MYVIINRLPLFFATIVLIGFEQLYVVIFDLQKNICVVNLTTAVPRNTNT